MSDEKDDPPGYVQENDLNQSPLFTEPNVALPYLPTSNNYQQQPIYPQQYPPPYSPAPGTIPPTQQPYPPQYPPTTGIPPYPQYQPQYYAPQQQQQQQSMNVVLGAPTAQFVVSSRPYNYVNFNGAIVLSCFVFFFCGWMCGLIAFIIASEFLKFGITVGNYNVAEFRTQSCPLAIVCVSSASIYRHDLSPLTQPVIIL